MYELVDLAGALEKRLRVDAQRGGGATRRRRGVHVDAVAVRVLQRRRRRGAQFALDEHILLGCVARGVAAGHLLLRWRRRALIGLAADRWRYDAALFEDGEDDVVDGGLLGQAGDPLLLLANPNGYLNGGDICRCRTSRGRRVARCRGNLLLLLLMLMLMMSVVVVVTRRGRRRRGGGAVGVRTGRRGRRRHGRGEQQVVVAVVVVVECDCGGGTGGSCAGTSVGHMLMLLLCANARLGHRRFVWCELRQYERTTTATFSVCVCVCVYVFCFCLQL